MKQAGGSVLGSVRHLLSSADMSSYLLQAQSSKANVIALANAGSDFTNSIKQAAEFGISQSGQSLAGLAVYLTDVKLLGLASGKGIYLSEPFYWNLNDQTRAFAKKFGERHGGAMPTSFQAGVYSGVLHYLKAAAALGSDQDGRAIVAKMKGLPTEDLAFGKGSVREDGRKMHSCISSASRIPRRRNRPGTSTRRLARPRPSRRSRLPIRPARWSSAEPCAGGSCTAPGRACRGHGQIFLGVAPPRAASQRMSRARMRIVSFCSEGQIRFGLRDGDGFRPFTGAAGRSFAALCEALAENTAEPDDRLIATAELLTPVPRPARIFCIGLNYADHAREGGHPIPTYPAVFTRVANSLVAHGQPLVMPAASNRFDYEAELAIVVGRAGRRIPAGRALAHVASYACFNDGSLRDYQRKSTQWTMGKNFDRSGSFGPHLVTPDELPEGAAGLRVATRLNGNTVQDGNTSDMIFDVATIVATLSEAMTLEPGDVIATGTPAGVGFARTPPLFMQPGDICEIEIEGVGLLRNAIGAESV